MKPETLIHRYLIGEATAEEVAELDGLLAAEPELRRKLVFEAGTDAGLREIALERQAAPGMIDQKIISPFFRPMAWIAAAASVMLLATLGWSAVNRPNVIAEITSVEDAAWESSLPTELGAPLTRGYLRLSSGIATIRFIRGPRSRWKRLPNWF